MILIVYYSCYIDVSSENIKKFLQLLFILFSVRATELESHYQVDSYDDTFLYTDGKQAQFDGNTKTGYI